MPEKYSENVCPSHLALSPEKKRYFLSSQSVMAMAEEGRHTGPVHTRAHSHAVPEGFVLTEGHVGAGVVPGAA